MCRGRNTRKHSLRFTIWHVIYISNGNYRKPKSSSGVRILGMRASSDGSIRIRWSFLTGWQTVCGTWGRIKREKKYENCIGYQKERERSSWKPQDHGCRLQLDDQTALTENEIHYSYHSCHLVRTD